MGYSAMAGSHEWAMLIIAHSVREARNLFWAGRPYDLEDYTDMRVKWLKESENVLPLADPAKLQADEAHLVDNPAYCRGCECWGGGIDNADRCLFCGEDPGPDVLKRLKGAKHAES